MRNESILFASDLDNTLLFSQPVARPGGGCVRGASGLARPRAFFSQRHPGPGAEINRTMRFVPVTSRSIAQFLRIQFPPGCVPKYALVANGGLLLRNGAVDPAWQARSLALVSPWRGELAKAGELLAQVPLPLRARMVDDLYLFAACDSPAEAAQALAHVQGKTRLTAELSGRKLYSPAGAEQGGRPLVRLRERFAPARVLCAGDSGIDVPMLEQADVAIVPKHGMVAGGVVWDGRGRFSEFVVEKVAAFGGGI
ncbi:MAG: hypothetical protein ACLUNZ_01065 [Evtepia sp.]